MGGGRHAKNVGPESINNIHEKMRKYKIQCVMYKYDKTYLFLTVSRDKIKQGLHLTLYESHI